MWCRAEDQTEFSNLESRIEAARLLRPLVTPRQRPVATLLTGSIGCRGQVMGMGACRARARQAVKAFRTDCWSLFEDRVGTLTGKLSDCRAELMSKWWVRPSALASPPAGARVGCAMLQPSTCWGCRALGGHTPQLGIDPFA